MAAKILVADDDRSIRTVIGRALERWDTMFVPHPEQKIFGIGSPMVKGIW